MIRCAISNTAPAHPVVGATTGLVYERSVIEKALQEDSKCPVTQVSLRKQDLISLKLDQPQISPPRSLDGTSIPSLLVAFQNEWDAMALETFKLRQTLDKTRRELAQALYQHDAACRVVARLAKERDEARAALGSASITTSDSGANTTTAVPVAAEGNGKAKKQRTAPIEPSPQFVALTAAEKRKIEETSAELLGTRASKRKAASSATGALKLTSETLIKSQANAISLDLDEEAGLFALGFANGSASIISRASRKVEREYKFGGESECSVRKVRLARNGKTILASCSDDRFRVASGVADITTANLDSSATDCCEHATHDFALVSDSKGGWYFVRIETGQIASRGSITPPGISSSCIDAHPDGKLFAIGGGSDGSVFMWDIISGTMATSLSISDNLGSVDVLDFSENGVSLASTHRSGGVVKIWDMRKPKDPVQSFALPVSKKETSKFAAAAFDTNGQAIFLATDDSSIQIRSVVRTGEWPLVFDGGAALSKKESGGSIKAIAAGRGTLLALTSSGIVTEWKE